MAPERPPAKLALSRDRILGEAVAFADEHGVAALTMRKLAERLGVGAMSLYTYVANKDEMIQGMVDAVTAEIEPPPAGVDWRVALGANAASAHKVLTAHPWAATEWSHRMPGPARLDYMEAILRVLTEAGLRDDLVYRGYHAITMHIVGFTLQELGYVTGLGDDDLQDMAQGFLDNMAENRLPYLADHVRAHLSDDDHGDEFGFVLDLILDGLDRANGNR